MLSKLGKPLTAAVDTLLPIGPTLEAKVPTELATGKSEAPIILLTTGTAANDALDKKGALLLALRPVATALLLRIGVLEKLLKPALLEETPRLLFILAGI